ncbi:hypothetical protein GOP47_0000647 [Adiantum capillus-veneris]|uniref:2-carboxy-D-arabinitol-1-phosphatase n=1 Tax=Adiantum capillus-veneris TaxID=13818 RepID=A0A9D4VDX7_ADICA|nr:hypothetical protein GOP47_0000647 [Adiantum capillus-veneris]
MVFTCNACCHGRSETLIPTLSTANFPADREQCVIAKRSSALRSGGYFFPFHVSNVRAESKPSTTGVHMVGTGVHGYKCGDVHRMADISSSLFGQGSILVDHPIAGSDPIVDSASCAEPISIPNHAALPLIQASKRVVLVRHGQSTWNAEGRIQGSSDFAVLTAKGESQAETSRQMLLSDVFDVCFHSPLARAKRTAEIIWGHRTNSMIPIDDLREIDLYGFQGLMKNEGKERYGNAYRTWQVDAANFLIDGHYPVRELWARAQKCWEEILCHSGQSILVVAHNAVNQALVATATGLGPEYFRLLLQSNCGVSVLDFAPRTIGHGLPSVCLDRLNQTPSPPVAGEQAGGRKAAFRIILVCHGATDSSVENRFPMSRGESLNMLGIIQARKTAELLLDVRVSLVLSSPQPTTRKTAEAIVEVQEAADCLGADCVPRYVEEKELEELADLDWGQWRGKSPAEVVEEGRWQDFVRHEDIEGGESISYFWNRAGCAWVAVLEHVKALEKTLTQDKNVVVVGHETMHTAMVGHCLGLTQASIGTFHVDTGSLSVIDLPDGPSGRGVDDEDESNLTCHFLILMNTGPDVKDGAHDNADSLAKICGLVIRGSGGITLYESSPLLKQ